MMRTKPSIIPSVGVAAALSLSLFLAPLALAATTGTLLPTGDGYSLQWTPSAGATHYTLVDESACNGTTDYVSTNTVGRRDAYSLSLASVPDGATITAIAILPCASRNSGGGGSATLNVFYRANGVNSADAGAYTLPSGTTPASLATTTFSSLAIPKVSTTTLEIGAVYSAGTKGVRLSRLASVLTYTVPTPAAPSGLSAVADPSSIALDLSWTDNSSDESGFVVERKLSTGSIYSALATTTVNVTTYVDSTVTQGTTYNYRVRAYNAFGYSGYTGVATGTAPSIPAAPFFVVPSASSSSVLLTSGTSTGATYYGFERSATGSSTGFSLIGTSSVNTFIDPAPGSGTWWYRSYAANVYGASGYSPASSVTLP